ncbi:unnamed protein product, partial [Onchocerca ochengi]
MSSLHQQDQANGIAAVDSDRNIFYPKLGGISTTTQTTTLSLSAPLIDHKLCKNCNLKRNEDSEQRIAELKLVTQKQSVNEFMIRGAQMQSTPLTCATRSQLRISKAVSQRNRELYKTTLCHFWSNRIPCRYGERC